jgi:hypothetical protein
VPIYALGTLLFGVSLWNFGRELGGLGVGLGPILAFLIDGPLSLSVWYAGYRLVNTSLGEKYKAAVAGWCLAGAPLSTAVVVSPPVADD